MPCFHIVIFRRKVTSCATHKIDIGSSVHALCKYGYRGNNVFFNQNTVTALYPDKNGMFRKFNSVASLTHANYVFQGKLRYIEKSFL